ncbi:MAG: GntR family transcriptional regulator [Hyphomicrobiaceae bacterium]|nr:MAG: GntR family transcriptional regulator [Hyphomicrobiaceae bacterium]
MIWSAHNAATAAPGLSASRHTNFVEGAITAHLLAQTIHQVTVGTEAMGTDRKARQVADAIAARIEAHDDDDFLPGRSLRLKRLMGRFGCAHGTVWAALARLRKRGIVEAPRDRWISKGKEAIAVPLIQTRLADERRDFMAAPMGAISLR